MLTTKSTTAVLLEDGKYSGKIGGYRVFVKVKAGSIAGSIGESLHQSHTITVEFNVEDGVRGFNIPCDVEVKNGNAVVTL